MLSSRGTRLRQTTMGTFLCSALRVALGVHTTLLNGGAIRASKDYADAKAFTYANLKDELRFDTPMAVLYLPGAVINATIAFSRQYARVPKPAEFGGFLQTDDDILWDRTSNSVLSIAGQPLNCSRLYLVAIPFDVLMGLDNLLPLTEYRNVCGPSDSNININVLTCIGAKEILVEHFSRQILYHLVFMKDFADLDLDGDGRISKAELKAIAKESYKGDEDLGDLVVENLFRVADLNGNGYISHDELTRSLSMLEEGLKFEEHHELDVFSVQEIIDEIAAKSKGGSSSEAVTAMMAALDVVDVNKSGFVTRKAYADVMVKMTAASHVAI